MRNTRSNRCISLSARLVSLVLACSSDFCNQGCYALPALACNRDVWAAIQSGGVFSQLLLPYSTSTFEGALAHLLHDTITRSAPPHTQHSHLQQH